jgi:hypothetical protein
MVVSGDVGVLFAGVNVDSIQIITIPLLKSG